MIEEQSTYFKLQLKTMSEELKLAKDIISDLKGQLRQVQKMLTITLKTPVIVPQNQCHHKQLPTTNLMKNPPSY